MFKDNDKNGFGTYHYSNGAKETGLYINDKEHGEHIYTDSNNISVIQKYDNGKRIENN